MSPPPLHQAKTENITTNLKKTNRVSHSIKKTSSSSSLNKPQQQHRQPVIIYTHSPRIIKTHPKDFMALVQKLTGLSHAVDSKEQQQEDDQSRKPPPKYHQPPKQEEPPMDAMSAAVCKEEEEEEEIEIETTSLMVTDHENVNYGFSCMGDQLKSCFMAAPPPPPVMMEPPMIPYVRRRLPMFAPTSSSAEFLCSSKPFLNYVDPLFF